jgi:hypothetical protein
MIWGKDDADCATKLQTAKTNGEVKLADRFDMKIWTKPAPMPAPRWTSFPRMMEVDRPRRREAAARNHLPAR